MPLPPTSALHQALRKQPTALSTALEVETSAPKTEESFWGLLCTPSQEWGSASTWTRPQLAGESPGDAIPSPPQGSAPCPAAPGHVQVLEHHEATRPCLAQQEPHHSSDWEYNKGFLGRRAVAPGFPDQGIQRDDSQRKCCLPKHLVAMTLMCANTWSFQGFGLLFLTRLLCKPHLSSAHPLAAQTSSHYLHNPDAGEAVAKPPFFCHGSQFAGTHSIISIQNFFCCLFQLRF